MSKFPIAELSNFIAVASPYLDEELGLKEVMADKDDLAEQIKTIRNLSETALVLRQLNRNELLPTILEIMFQEIQDINDTACVARNDGENNN